MKGINFTIQNPDSIPTTNRSVIYYDHIYLSSDDLQAPIANQLTLNLKYEQPGPLIDTKVKDKPFSNISFSYGSNVDDLTYELMHGQESYNSFTTAIKITASIGENTLWSLEEATDTSISTI
jgi:hypothetical protein